MSIEIPNYLHTPMVDDKGYPTDTWSLLLTQLLTGLQGTLSNQGMLLPSVDQGTVDQLNQSPDGSMLYNPDSQQMMVRINGVFKNVTTS